MSRADPRCEIPRDIASAKQIIAACADAWGCDGVYIGDEFNCVDGAFYRGSRLVGYCEAKHRGCHHFSYDTYIISANKVLSGIDLAERDGVPFVLAIEWNDGIRWRRVTHTHFWAFEREMGGRANRPEMHVSTDREIVLHIPVGREGGWRKI